MEKSFGFNRIVKIENGIISFCVKHKGIEYLAYIDEKDKDILIHTWSLTLNKNGTYKKIRASINQKQVAIHRKILGIEDPAIKVDHKDGNILNNRRSNLRACSVAQNTKNTKLRINNSSGFKGVSFIKRLNKYRAYIVINYKQINLGLYKTSEEAAVAYNGAAIKFHKEFAKINVGIS